jgi:phospholipid transport system substrate-binding protein
MNRRDFLTLGASVLVIGGGIGASHAADPAVALIERFYVSLKGAMQRAGGSSVAARAKALSGPVNSTFGMTRIALGPNAKTVGGKQGAITQAFGQFLVANYAKQFGSYNGEQFEVSPGTEKRRIGKLVRTQITDGGGSSHNIQYIVAGGRVIDIYLNSSVSELATRRAEFDSLIKSGGADALLTSLKKRTATLLAS